MEQNKSSPSQFMTPFEHFEELLSRLDAEEQKMYAELTHVRIEACYRNRTFVVYRFQDRRPAIKDNIKVLDFICNDDAGASCELRSSTLNESLVVGYEPTQLFNYPVFVHLPLHGKLRWSTTADKPYSGTLAFDLVIKTQTRRDLRERGVTYFETGVNYAKEFEGLAR